MNFLEDTYKRWICPSDRELTLRAKLRSGWSSRAQNDTLTGINETEQAAIAEVLERANRLQAIEEERIRLEFEQLDSNLKEIRSDLISLLKSRCCCLCHYNRQLLIAINDDDDESRKLNERLEKIKRQACGNGKKSCILCNDQPKLFSKFYTCKDCQNAVCNKCSIDTHEVETDETIWLCKICSESREVIKKTNMWTQLCTT